MEIKSTCLDCSFINYFCLFLNLLLMFCCSAFSVNSALKALDQNMGFHEKAVLVHSHSPGIGLVVMLWWYCSTSYAYSCWLKQTDKLRKGPCATVN